MKRSVLTLAILTSAAALQAGGAAAIQDDGTRVEDLSAEVNGADLTVAGNATFLDVPLTVGTDPSGDAAVAGIGTDFVAATIARPDPFGDDLRFTVAIDDQPDSIEGVPEAICYGWSINVAAADGSSSTWEVRGYRTQQGWAPGGLEASFRLHPGFPVLDDGRPLTGRIEEGVAEFNLPMAAVGAEPGATIRQPTLESIGPGIQTRVTTANVTRCTGGAGSLDAMTFDGYTIPEPLVGIGIAPEETPPEAIPTTVQASVSSDGRFAGALGLADRPPGTYVVIARACYGEQNCGEAATTITI